MKIIYLLQDWFEEFIENLGFSLFAIFMICCISYGFYKGVEKHLKDMDRQQSMKIIK